MIFKVIESSYDRKPETFFGVKKGIFAEILTCSKSIRFETASNYDSIPLNLIFGNDFLPRAAFKEKSYCELMDIASATIDRIWDGFAEMARDWENYWKEKEGKKRFRAMVECVGKIYEGKPFTIKGTKKEFREASEYVLSVCRHFSEEPCAEKPMIAFPISDLLWGRFKWIENGFIAHIDCKKYESGAVSAFREEFIETLEKIKKDSKREGASFLTMLAKGEIGTKEFDDKI